MDSISLAKYSHLLNFHMKTDKTTQAESVLDAITTRHSVRAFLSDPVNLDQLSDILNRASRAPSGTNMQPWKARVFTGNALTSLCTVVSEAFDEKPQGYNSEVPYYPATWFEPYKSRRRKVGLDLYGLLNLEKGDSAGMHTQHRRNFSFFDAPVGMIFTIHRDLATGSWLDYGMYLQNIMLAARAYGLHTCPQAAWADFHPQIRAHLALPDEEVVVCGMALGFADWNAVENQLITERAPISDQVEYFS